MHPANWNFSGSCEQGTLLVSITFSPLSICSLQREAIKIAHTQEGGAHYTRCGELSALTLTKSLYTLASMAARISGGSGSTYPGSSPGWCSVVNGVSGTPVAVSMKWPSHSIWVCDNGTMFIRCACISIACCECASLPRPDRTSSARPQDASSKDTEAPIFMRRVRCKGPAVGIASYFICFSSTTPARCLVVL